MDWDNAIMNTSWVLVGFLSAPQMARIEMHYETEPSGYRAHWTFDEVRVGTLPALAIRGPKEQVQLMELDFQIPEEGIVQSKVRERRPGSRRNHDPSAGFHTHHDGPWGQEARIVSNHREPQWIGRNRWLDAGRTPVDSMAHRKRIDAHHSTDRHSRSHNPRIQRADHSDIEEPKTNGPTQKSRHGRLIESDCGFNARKLETPCCESCHSPSFWLVPKPPTIM